MKYYKKNTFTLLLIAAGLTVLQSCRTKTPWNPYLSAKEKPSDKQRKEEQKQIKAGTKAYAELMIENKKSIQGNVQKATSSKRHYKQITKHHRKRKTKKRNWYF